jgi:hypothetical protein
MHHSLSKMCTFMIAENGLSLGYVSIICHNCVESLQRQDWEHKAREPCESPYRVLCARDFQPGVICCCLISHNDVVFHPRLNIGQTRLCVPVTRLRERLSVKSKPDSFQPSLSTHTPFSIGKEAQFYSLAYCRRAPRHVVTPRTRQRQTPKTRRTCRHSLYDHSLLLPRVLRSLILLQILSMAQPPTRSAESPTSTFNVFEMR